MFKLSYLGEGVYLNGDKQRIHSHKMCIDPFSCLSIFCNMDGHVLFQMWLFLCLIVLTPLSTIFQLYRGGQYV